MPVSAPPEPRLSFLVASDAGREEISVAVVGLGSRGLSVLERLLTLARKGEPGGRIRIEVVDPDCTGYGLHKTDQPDYLLLNTTCGQVSMFPDRFTVGDEACEPGPSLYEWATARGLKIAADGFSVGSVGREIQPHDFLPRRVLGEYLDWFRRHLEAGVPDHVHVMVAGRIVRSGRKELALELEERGYDWTREESHEVAVR